MNLSGSTPPPPPPVAVEPAAPEYIVPATFSQLEDADRRAAYNAQVSAVTDGKRKPWKGAKGVYGYVDPGTVETKDDKTCRKYTETVYFAGRPKSGSGLGCKQPDGQWRIVN